MGKHLTPNRIVNVARRSKFASRAVAVSSQAAIQAQQISHSLYRLTEMVEELAALSDAAIRQGALPASQHLFPQRSLAMGRQLDSQLRLLQRTIETLQGMARIEVNQ